MSGFKCDEYRATPSTPKLVRTGATTTSTRAVARLEDRRPDASTRSRASDATFWPAASGATQLVTRLVVVAPNDSNCSTRRHRKRFVTRRHLKSSHDVECRPTFAVSRIGIMMRVVKSLFRSLLVAAALTLAVETRAVETATVSRMLDHDVKTSLSACRQRPLGSDRAMRVALPTWSRGSMC